MAKLFRKCRLCRREGAKLFLKGERCFSSKCPLEKKGAVPPGVHGLKSGARPSEYGRQLRAKQKIKRYYGISESQLKRYFQMAKKLAGDTGENLLVFLERRLDNVVYRLGFAPSRATARQLISHGFVFVNHQKVTIPSYLVDKGDIITLSPKAGKMDKIQNWREKKLIETPKWLVVNNFQGRVKVLPKRNDAPADFEENLVIEFYSR